MYCTLTDFVEVCDRPIRTTRGDEQVRERSTAGGPPTREEIILSTWSRRDLLRVSAGAAVVAVPMGALSRNAAAAAKATPGSSPTAVDGVDAAAEMFDVGDEPVMFCIHDAKLGEVSILHGTNEVVVKDPQLVRRIMHAASRQKL
jgi:hypothetical protein